MSAVHFIKQRQDPMLIHATKHLVFFARRKHTLNDFNQIRLKCYVFVSQLSVVCSWILWTDRVDILCYVQRFAIILIRFIN